jgi:hypothetical protein
MPNGSNRVRDMATFCTERAADGPACRSSNAFCVTSSFRATRLFGAYDRLLDP